LLIRTPRAVLCGAGAHWRPLLS